MSELPPGASCLQMPIEAVDEYFFESQINHAPAKLEMARRICRNCVVLQECRSMALEEMPPYGVMAGMTPRDRDRVKYGNDAA